MRSQLITVKEAQETGNWAIAYP